jgi:hypothetical protein
MVVFKHALLSLMTFPAYWQLLQGAYKIRWGLASNHHPLTQKQFGA